MSYSTKKIDERVIELLKHGGVGLLPTDTIYGLSAAALDERAVQKIHKLKERDEGKPLVVLIADMLQLAEIGLKTESAELIEKHWPGPLSVIFRSLSIPHWLHMSTNSLAVRLPDDENLRNLIMRTGPIVSSSANVQGQKPAISPEEAKRYFGDSLDFYVDAGKLEGQPSTLVKIENDIVKIIRQGACDLGI